MFASALALVLLSAEPSASIDFALPDVRGRARRLDEWRDRRLLVLFFLSADCPLVRLYAPRLAAMARTYGPRGVGFVGVAPSGHDTPAGLARFARRHDLDWPFLIDAGAVVADRLGVRVVPQVVVLDEARVVRYRGRIDDQYVPGQHKARPSRSDLTEALDDLLANRDVSQPTTTAVGCVVDGAASRRPAVTYCRDVAPILQNHCVVCHRPGQAAPFALTDARSAASHAETIRDVVEEGRMPPWHADPAHGRFANDPRLTNEQKQILYDWIDAGCPEGDVRDLSPPRSWPDDWATRPDVVLTMPEPFAVPAEGVIEYQHVAIDPGFREDKWVKAIEVRPGNRGVLHHCNVFLKPPGRDAPTTQGALGSYCLAVWAPGRAPIVYPDGTAKKLPAGWSVVLVLHYTPIGRAQTDRTSVGLTFADAANVRREVATQLMVDETLCLPPRAADVRVTQTWRVNRPVLLLSMYPHMHLRGRSFRYDVTYPDGVCEVLLDVPRYDFAWQHDYVLAEPKRLPTGALVRCTAIYDNSAGNPANPDPDAEVRAGRQSTDEMFNGYFDVTLADEDRWRMSPTPLLMVAGGLAGALVVMRRGAKHAPGAAGVVTD